MTNNYEESRPVLDDQPMEQQEIQFNLNDIDPKYKEEVKCSCGCGYWKDKILCIKVIDPTILNHPKNPSKEPVYFNITTLVCEDCGSRIPEKP